MSSYSEVIGLIVEINRIITAQAQRIELTASSTSQLMDLVMSSIDGAPSKYVPDVKSGITGLAQISGRRDLPGFHEQPGQRQSPQDVRPAAQLH